MKIGFLVVASLLAVQVNAFDDNHSSNRCKSMNVRMGVHKAEPLRPDRSPDAKLLPKAQSGSSGPAVLIPDCRDEDMKQRKKDDDFLA